MWHGVNSWNDHGNTQNLKLHRTERWAWAELETRRCSSWFPCSKWFQRSAKGLGPSFLFFDFPARIRKTTRRKQLKHQLPSSVFFFLQLKQIMFVAWLVVLCFSCLLPRLVSHLSALVSQPRCMESVGKTTALSRTHYLAPVQSCRYRGGLSPRFSHLGFATFHSLPQKHIF